MSGNPLNLESSRFSASWGRSRKRWSVEDSVLTRDSREHQAGPSRWAGGTWGGCKPPTAQRLDLRVVRGHWARPLNL